MQIARRAFLSTIAAGTGSLLCGELKAGVVENRKPADVNLRIGSVRVDVAPGHTVAATGYNGSAPGPLIRLRENNSVMVEIFNDTDLPEYVHWHGLPVWAELDGTEEEGSLVVAPHGHLRYRMTPEAPGSRYVHSHVMAGDDLTRGVYSGQFAFVYVEPNRHPGRYDQEVFLATHEWEPAFVEGEEEGSGVNPEEYLGEMDWGPPFVEVGYRVRSINGKALGHGEPIRVKEGQRVLLHILNASATENIQLSLPGHEFLVVALDGNPVPRPRRVEVLELGVAERVDAIVEMTNPGVWILGSTDDDVRGSGLGILVEYAGRKGTAATAKPAGIPWDYTQFGGDQEAGKPDETIPLVIERVAPDAAGYERWTINGESYEGAKEPKTLRKGAHYRLVLDNRTGDAHPLHLHRNTFELTKVNGQRTAGIKKDVVLVKGYQTVEIDFTPMQGGLALFHCHQQLHMDHGFKKLFRVTEGRGGSPSEGGRERWLGSALRGEPPSWLPL
jgi:FtsP/CotA-like multicopper oxidase with cupredoxin domain